MRTREVEWSHEREWSPWTYEDALHLISPAGDTARKMTDTGWRSAVPDLVRKEGKAIREPDWEPWIKDRRWFLMDADGFNCLECTPSGWCFAMASPVRQEGRRMVRSHWMHWRLGQRHFLMAPEGDPCFELTPYGWMEKNGGSVARNAQPIGFEVERNTAATLTPMEAARDRSLVEFTSLSFPADVRYMEFDGRPVAIFTSANGQPTATVLDGPWDYFEQILMVLDRGREVDGLTFLKMVAEVDESQCPFRHLLSNPVGSTSSPPPVAERGGMVPMTHEE